MISRCYDETDPNYKHYGKRGIEVCERWHDHNVFISDLLPSFKSYLVLDRIDNDRGYEINNVRFVTPKSSVENRRNTKLICADGTTMTEARFLRKYKLSSNLISTWRKRGNIDRKLEELQNKLNISIKTV